MISTPPFIVELEQLGIKVVLPIERVIYKYVSLETAMKIVEGHSLLFSAPSKFNDPFDLTNSLIDLTFDEQTFRQWVNSNQDITLDQKRAALAKKYDPIFIFKTLNETLDKFKNAAGITCFSKSYLKTLMWSHYADKHAGVCLGFNIIPVGLENFTLLEVNYAEEIKPLNYFTDKPHVLMYWLYTKSKIWAYEEEVRAVFTDRNGLIPFSDNALREVHFGLRTTEKQRELFLKTLVDLNYNVGKITVMSMNPKTFDLKENPIALPLF